MVATGPATSYKMCVGHDRSLLTVVCRMKVLNRLRAGRLGNGRPANEFTELGVFPNVSRPTSERSDTKSLFSIQRAASESVALRCAISWNELYVPRHQYSAFQRARYTPQTHEAP